VATASPSSKNLTDEQLMVHVNGGDDDALAILFDRYHRLVLSIGLKVLCDLGEAEDLAQSVFLEISRVAGQFDPGRGTTKIWILQYAYSRSINRRRYLLRRDFYAQGDFDEATRKAQLEHSSGEGVTGGRKNALLPKELTRLLGDEACSFLTRAIDSTNSLSCFSLIAISLKVTPKITRFLAT
jgi:DNA-directed RNA polymerase specialized sigma24 family protein